jgi:hypothetical protein
MWLDFYHSSGMAKTGTEHGLRAFPDRDGRDISTGLLFNGLKKL